MKIIPKSSSIHIKNNNWRYPLKNMVFGQNKLVIDKIKTEGLGEVITHSPLLKNLVRRNIKITDIKYISEGSYKFCHKLIFDTAAYPPLALLSAKHRKMNAEYAFYKAHQNIQNFPRTYENMHISHKTFIHGFHQPSSNFFIREFINGPQVSELQNNMSVMINFLHSVRKLMDMGVQVESEMDIGNLNNAFYLRKQNMFKFIDHRTGVHMKEWGIPRIIRVLSKNESRYFRNHLINIFIKMPEFRRLVGRSIKEVEEYWDILDEIPLCN